MNAQCRKVLRDHGESSKKTRKSHGKAGADVRGIRKAQQQQSRFRALREEELQGPPSRTRASLKRRLHEPSLSTKIQVERKLKQEDKTQFEEPEENPGTDVGAPNSEEPFSAALSINQSLPDKQTLEHIIDILQRKDIYEIFAEPVDPEEVEDYYEIIEEPMDFGTMRAKLHEGMYTSLKQFEHDVFLISGNAMHFNSSGTIFFRQAHAIHKLAKRVFHVLRTNPETFESEFSGTRRRSCRRSQDDEFNCKSFLKTTDKTSTGGSRDGKICDSIEADRRSTYKPYLDINNDKFPKSLIYLNHDQEHNYRKSLMQFVKDLGPTAQMVAKRKLHGMFGDASVISHQTIRKDPQIPSGQTKNLMLFGSCYSVLSDGKQESTVTGITKTATQNRIIRRDQDSSCLTTSQVSRTSNVTDRDESNRLGGHMDSVVTSSTRGLFTRPLMPHGALDLGLLKSKMHGEDEWWRRI